MKALSFYDKLPTPLVYQAQVGVLITEQMDQEIDRLLPEFGQSYKLARKEKKQQPVGVFNFSNPYNSCDWPTPLVVDYQEGEYAPLGWAGFHKVAVNAAIHEDLKPWMFRRVIAHELIHAIDPNKPKRGHYSYPEDGMDIYLAQDVEFDAYSGMIGYSFRKNAKTWRGTEHHQAWVERLKQSLDVLEDPKTNFDAKVTGAFDPYYAWVVSEYQRLLTADRFSLFAGRVRLAINDSLVHLAGESDTPFVRLAMAT